jgi:hypothetical protein
LGLTMNAPVANRSGLPIRLLAALSYRDHDAHTGG